MYLEKIENDIGIFSASMNLILMILPMLLINYESEYLNKGIAIFLPNNFVHFTESVMIQPEIHSQFCAILFSLTYTLFFSFTQFSFTTLFFLMGAINAFILSYVFSSNTRKVYEKIIKIKKEKLSTQNEVIKSLDEPVILVNSKCDIIFKNDAFDNINCNVEKENSKPILEELFDDNQKSLKEYILDLFLENSKEGIKIFKVFIKKASKLYSTGNSFFVSFIKKQFKAVNSLGIAIIIKDIGNEIELKVMKKAKEFTNLMLYSMSHEVRTPINGIIGIFHILKKKVAQELKDTIYMGISCSAFLTSQIKCIMDFAQIIKGEFTIHGESINIRDFLKKIQKIGVRFLVEKRESIKFEVIVEENIPKEILGDSERIMQIILNLLTNSIKYTDKGFIKIIASMQDKYELEISIIDSGCGLSTNQISILNSFKPDHYDVINKEYKTFPGFKLSICQMILEKHKSKLIAHSLEGLGSHISFKIPQIENKASKISDSSILENINEQSIYSLANNYDKCKYTLHLKTLSGLKLKYSSFSSNLSNLTSSKVILIADDVEMNRFVLKNMLLSIHDYKCYEAENGMEAWHQAEKIHNLHLRMLIFMDIDMPIMDGIEATKNIRKFSCCPIIAITAYASEDIREKALEAGINAVLTKPVSIKQLKSVLASYGF